MRKSGSFPSHESGAFQAMLLYSVIFVVVCSVGRDAARRCIRSQSCSSGDFCRRNYRTEYSLCTEMRRSFFRVADDCV